MGKVCTQKYVADQPSEFSNSYLRREQDKEVTSSKVAPTTCLLPVPPPFSWLLIKIDEVVGLEQLVGDAEVLGNISAYLTSNGGR